MREVLLVLLTLCACLGGLLLITWVSSLNAIQRAARWIANRIGRTEKKP